MDTPWKITHGTPRFFCRRVSLFKGGIFRFQPLILVNMIKAKYEKSPRKHVQLKQWRFEGDVPFQLADV